MRELLGYYVDHCDNEGFSFLVIFIEYPRLMPESCICIELEIIHLQTEDVLTNNR